MILEAYAATATIALGIVHWRKCAWAKTARAFDQIAEEWAAKWRETSAELAVAVKRWELRGSLMQQADADRVAAEARADAAEAKLRRFTAPRERNAKGHFLKVVS